MFLKKNKEFLGSAGKREELRSCLTQASRDSPEDSIRIIFKCEYSCSIVIKKDSLSSPINIQIVAPEEWSSGAHDWTTEQLDFCEPKNSSQYYISSVAENDVDIEKFSGRFEGALDSALKSIEASLIKEGKPAEYSAKVIHKACKMAVVMSKFATHYNDYREPMQKDKQLS
jgi:hypothetical protein